MGSRGSQSNIAAKAAGFLIGFQTYQRVLARRPQRIIVRSLLLWLWSRRHQSSVRDGLYANKVIKYRCTEQVLCHLLLNTTTFIIRSTIFGQ